MQTQRVGNSLVTTTPATLPNTQPQEQNSWLGWNGRIARSFKGGGTFLRSNNEERRDDKNIIARGYSKVNAAGNAIIKGIGKAYSHLCSAGATIKAFAQEIPGYAGSAFSGAWFGLAGGYVLGGVVGIGVGVSLVALGWPGVILAVPAAAAGGLIGGGVGGGVGAPFAATVNCFRRYRNSWSSLCIQKDQEIADLKEQLDQLRLAKKDRISQNSNNDSNV